MKSMSQSEVEISTVKRQTYSNAFGLADLFIILMKVYNQRCSLTHSPITYIISPRWKWHHKLDVSCSL